MSTAADPPTPVQAFPETRSQWIAECLSDGDGGMSVANVYLMENYLRPLTTYCRAIDLGKSVRRECDELVHEFFADRLGDPEYLKSWLASKLRLRNWLRNGLHLYVHELRRAERAHAGELVSHDELAADISDQDQVFERAWAKSALDLAIKEAIRRLEAKGRRSEWDIFWLHHIQGLPHAKLGEMHKLSPAQVAQRVFAVAEQLRSILAGILRRDGVLVSEVDFELRTMMEAMHESRP